MADNKKESRAAQELEQEYRQIMRSETPVSLPLPIESWEQSQPRPLTRIVTTYGAYEEPF